MAEEKRGSRVGERQEGDIHSEPLGKPGWEAGVTCKPGEEPRQFLILLPVSAEQWKVLQTGHKDT